MAGNSGLKYRIQDHRFLGPGVKGEKFEPGAGFVDVRNYLVTADRIEGPWSDPILLNRTGFDPSLFHDRDGRKWLVNTAGELLDAATVAGLAAGLRERTAARTQ